ARLFETAVKLGFRLRVEADQFEHGGAVPLAVEARAMAVSHLENSSAEDLAMLCASDTIATLCPGPAFHLGTNRFAQARALIDGGAAVALATNFNPHTSPTCNMQMILSLACSQLGMMPGEAISAATINGAHSLGCADRVGSLEHGKSADLLLLNVSDYREMPYYFGVNSVHLTIKRGVVLYQEGRVESLPQEN
ncbi:MAG TPA: amidohydrolase family protein, partial [Bryobacteraceae bacterium]|nr:amidohydrolase family protein [Bryobacteraceae bacterium]